MLHGKENEHFGYDNILIESVPKRQNDRVNNDYITQK